MNSSIAKAAARNYRDLIAWQEAIGLAKAVYALILKLPRQEVYGLSDQMRRAAVSVPSDIAEGQARKVPAEFRHFLHIASGSLAELDTQLVLAEEFGYLTQEDLGALDPLIQSIRMKLYALINSLTNK